MKRSLILMLSMFACIHLNSQTTLIPDSHFEQVLIDLGFDSGEIDGQVLTANIENVEALYIPSGDFTPLDITDLTGIQDFTELRVLRARFCDISIVDLSQNLLLTEVDFAYNDITELDVTNNDQLTTLKLSSNQISELDLSNNPQLEYLGIDNNDLTALDLSNNPELTDVICAYNFIENLDVSIQSNLVFLWAAGNNLTELKVNNGNNENLEVLIFGLNPNLTCVQVDDPVFAEENWPISNTILYNSELVYSLDCSQVSSISETEFQYAIYPNPTSGNLSIESNGQAHEIRILDQLGRDICRITALESGLIDLSQQNLSGMYHVHLLDDRGNILFSEHILFER